MLVLSRKQDQSIVIGDDIVITITLIQGNRIRLGIEAPKEVRVVRGELVRHDVAETVNNSDPPTYPQLLAGLTADASRLPNEC